MAHIPCLVVRTEETGVGLRNIVAAGLDIVAVVVLEQTPHAISAGNPPASSHQNYWKPFGLMFVVFARGVALVVCPSVGLAFGTSFAPAFRSR